MIDSRMEQVIEQKRAVERCIRCYEPVPVNAARCPHCRQPLSNAKRFVPMIVGAAGVLALLFLLVMMYRVVYLTDLEHAKPLEDEQSVARDPFANPATSASQDKPAAKSDDKPAETAKPDKPPPLNQ